MQHKSMQWYVGYESKTEKMEVYGNSDVLGQDHSEIMKTRDITYYVPGPGPYSLKMSQMELFLLGSSWLLINGSEISTIC